MDQLQNRWTVQHVGLELWILTDLVSCTVCYVKLLGHLFPKISNVITKNFPKELFQQ
jgi:hypothetical protein